MFSMLSKKHAASVDAEKDAFLLNLRQTHDPVYVAAVETGMSIMSSKDGVISDGPIPASPHARLLFTQGLLAGMVASMESEKRLLNRFLLIANIGFGIIAALLVYWVFSIK